MTTAPSSSSSSSCSSDASRESAIRFKALKTAYAAKVHRFVKAWLEEGGHDDIACAWDGVSRTKLGNLLKADVARPKKYKNKYICFCEIVRPQLRAEFPERSMENITRLMGERWKKFCAGSGTELHERVEAVYNEDQARFRREKSLSLSLSGTRIDGRTKRKGRVPESEYAAFCRSVRSERPKVTMLELAAMWAQRKMNSTGAPGLVAE